jgi:type III secretory pathway lipoprotein EscJ
MKKISLLLIILLCFSSCRAVSIADNVDQNQANQIVALLNSRGISSYARKDSGGKDSYSVEVDQAYYAQAKTMLVEKDLPKKAQVNLSELMAPQGLLPNSREIEAIRIDQALALQVESILLAHPAVAHAKAVVRNSSVESEGNKGASVVIQKLSSSNLASADVLKIVHRVLPDISEQNILISVEEETKGQITGEVQGVYNKSGNLSYVPLVPFLFNWRVPDTDFNAMVFVLIGCFLVLGLIGALIGYWFGYYHHSRQFIDQGLPDLTARSLKIERSVRDMPEV